MKNNIDKASIKKLKSISNDVELSMIKAILEDNNIAYIVEDSGSGGYMRIVTGHSVFSTDVMVGETDFDKANDLLKSISISID